MKIARDPNNDKVTRDGESLAETTRGHRGHSTCSFQTRRKRVRNAQIGHQCQRFIDNKKVIADLVPESEDSTAKSNKNNHAEHCNILPPAQTAHYQYEVFGEPDNEVKISHPLAGGWAEREMGGERGGERGGGRMDRGWDCYSGI